VNIFMLFANAIAARMPAIAVGAVRCTGVFLVAAGDTATVILVERHAGLGRITTTS
jgi:hypothetical protein